LWRASVESRASSVRLAPLLHSPAWIAYWTKELQETEAELEAAKMLTAVKAAAKKLQRAKAELKALEDVPTERPKRRATRGWASGALPHNLLAFVDLEAR
jgi:hypothetical protein